MSKCRTAQVRHIRLAHFDRGKTLAERALKIDSQVADGHCALFCSRGEKLRIDGENYFSSGFGFRRMMSALAQTLILNPNHLDALSAKGTFFIRLPRLLGNETEKGEQVLHRVIRHEPTSVSRQIM